MAYLVSVANTLWIGSQRLYDWLFFMEIGFAGRKQRYDRGVCWEWERCFVASF